MTPSPILFHLERGTLLRRDWGDGYERAFLLSALAPDVATVRYWGACPSWVMPLWLAALTPLMDGRGSDAAWEPMVRRYADLAARWHVLDKAAWHRALRRVLCAILCVEPSHLPVVFVNVIDLLRNPEGIMPGYQWKMEAAAARVREACVEAEAAKAMALAAEARVSPSLSVAMAMEAIAVATVITEITVIARVDTDAWAKAMAAAWDRITLGVLNAIEAEIVKANDPPMTTSPILLHLERGTLFRRGWGEGYGYVSLIAALSPETAKSRDWNDCPAEVMPPWLAMLTPLMDVRGSADAWEPMVRKYADLAARWHVFNAAGWHRALHGVLVALMRVVQPHAPDVVDPVVELLQRPVGTVTVSEWRSAEVEAWGATVSADAAAKSTMATAARAATEAAAAAKSAAASEKAAAAEATNAEKAPVEAAKDAAAKASNAKGAAMALDVAAWSSMAVLWYAREHEEMPMALCWDTTTSAILDAIEAEITMAEAAKKALEAGEAIDGLSLVPSQTWQSR